MFGVRNLDFRHGCAADRVDHTTSDLHGEEAMTIYETEAEPNKDLLAHQEKEHAGGVRNICGNGGTSGWPH